MPRRRKLTTLPQRDTAFIPPMECLPVLKLSDTAHWIWEIKINGYACQLASLNWITKSFISHFEQVA
jgi:hypothetical protein